MKLHNSQLHSRPLTHLSIYCYTLLPLLSGQTQVLRLSFPASPAPPLFSNFMASFSQGIVFTTAMVLSSTVLYLAFSRQKATPQFKIHGVSDSQESNKQILRSCLYSGRLTTSPAFLTFPFLLVIRSPNFLKNDFSMCDVSVVLVFRGKEKGKEVE